jgi:hypothetical protein
MDTKNAAVWEVWASITRESGWIWQIHAVDDIFTVLNKAEARTLKLISLNGCKC